MANSDDINGKDLSQILMGYTKSQAISREFLYVIEQVTIQNFDKLKPREMAEILYTLSNKKNNYYSHHLCEKILNYFQKYSEKFKVQEIVHLLTALFNSQNIYLEQKNEQVQVSIKKEEISNQQKHDQKDKQQDNQQNNNEKQLMLDNNIYLNYEVLQKFNKAFILRGDNCNILDVSEISHVFFSLQYVPDDFIQLIRQQYKDLKKTIDPVFLIKFLTNCDILLNNELLPHRFFKELMKTLALLVDQKQITYKQEKELKNMALNINHVHFRQLFLNTLKGQVPTIYQQMEKKREEELNLQKLKKIKQKTKYAIFQTQKDKGEKNPQFNTKKKANKNNVSPTPDLNSNII
ncbi:hypothetical protein PPERSA_01791 [Pseudocohnilembus persalinus]|uniref:Uncharacterized protein n=1 Tax=Pseudocohnilembus persalinus TaxID=266149 RepID=A0A0V0R1Y3_PSEPJ|nr:hypothetical protein PPERSA_01791 [Pseudocohnilembus persalinus]|eukprot:KRX08330.1 hypothetical protein PPERSA_01791 [Pseudocohnilembus persalinus]